MRKLLPQNVAINMLDNQIGLTKTKRGGGVQMEGGVCFMYNVTSPGVKELHQILVAAARLASN